MPGVAVLTNREFGDRIGVSPSMASRIRNGDRLPSLRVLQAIHEEFGTPVDKLLGEASQGPEQFGQLVRTELASR